HTRITTTTSPVEAMKLEEIARSQVFLRVAILTCFAGVLVALVTGGDPVAFRVVLLGCILSTAGALWMLASLRDPASYTPRRTRSTPCRPRRCRRARSRRPSRITRGSRRRRRPWRR
ncbi:MAG TPA: hypothetical protein VLT45_17100, partial [Kofleriaceae bacterium]|nr:hypothetical protein [Kofleriaceae bacterium]